MMSGHTCRLEEPASEDGIGAHLCVYSHNTARDPVVVGIAREYLLEASRNFVEVLVNLLEAMACREI